METARSLIIVHALAVLPALLISLSLWMGGAGQSETVEGSPSSDRIPADAKRYPRVTEEEARKFIREGSLTERTLPASLLVEALEQQPGPTFYDQIDLEACFIEGDISLSDVKVERTLLVDYSRFDGRITFERVEFAGVGFEYSVFSEHLRAAVKTIFHDKSWFNRNEFQAGVDFSGAHFEGGVDFTASRFADDEAVLVDTIADFKGAKFWKQALFTDAKFLSEPNFDEAEFNTDVLFDRTEFHGNTSFAQTNFKGIVSFREASIAGELAFKENTFARLASFDDMREFNGVENKERQSKLVFYGVTFQGPASFNGLKVSDLSTPTNLPSNTGEKPLYSGTVFEKSVNFRGVQLGTGNFRGAEFRDYADFSYSRFEQDAWFTDVTFRDVVNFNQVEFPAGSGVHLQNVRFLKPPQLDWEQLSGRRLADQDERTLDTLEQAFKAAGNLESQNEAFYRRKSVVEQGIWDRFLRYFWGFGVRPSFVLGWIVLVHLLLTFAYWTQTRPLAQAGGSELARVSYAWNFGWKTASTWGYGFQNSLTTTFKVLTLIHAFVIKLLLIFFLLALSNTSPLIHSILGKLLPM